MFGMVGPMAGPSGLEFDQGNAWILGTPGGGQRWTLQLK